MQYYRCKCGNATSYGSMPPKPCRVCPDCGYTLAQHPDHHSNPIPHKWIEKKVILNGVEVSCETYCKVCFVEKEALQEKEGCRCERPVLMLSDKTKCLKCQKPIKE